MDFQKLGDNLLPQARSLLSQWLPGGKIQGHEYVCGSISGGPGASFKVNLKTGAWAEFAGDLKGGDLISLYAAIKGLTQAEAYLKLDGKDAVSEAPKMIHPLHGQPAASWIYRTRAGNPWFYVARYNTANGKEFLPWIFLAGRWVCKGIAAPRPLYGLDVLESKDTAPVLVVEGEKSAEAAKNLALAFAVVTWPNGAKAWAKTDWSPVYGREILLWPDADEPGRKAMAGIGAALLAYCPAIQILDIDNRADGWDAADALAEKWTAKEFLDLPRRALVKPSPNGNGSVNPSEVFIEEPKKKMCNAANVLQFLKTDPGYAGHVWFDEFHRRTFSDLGDAVKEWTDTDDVHLMMHLQRGGLPRLGVDMVRHAINEYAHLKIRNEPRDWMDGLKWDGKMRIADFFMDCLGAERLEDSSYLYAAGHNFWISLAARIYSPGCQLYNMVVMEGAQGTGKTSALKLIGGPWYAEAIESIEKKDFFMTIGGKLLIEISELESFRPAEVTRIKQIISNGTDRFRYPYESRPADHPRTCVFVGTTNEDAYLRDATGAKRFWPVRCGKIDLPSIQESRSQLFAEAAAAFKKGEPWHLMPGTQTQETQESRREIDALEDLLSDKLNFDTPITLAEACTLLGISAERMDRRIQLRVGNALRKLGYDKKVFRTSGRLQKKWYKNPS